MWALPCRLKTPCRFSTEFFGNPDGLQILWLDVADDALEVAFQVAVVTGARCRFNGIAPAAEGRVEAIAHFNIVEVAGKPEAGIASETS